MIRERIRVPLSKTGEDVSVWVLSFPTFLQFSDNVNSGLFTAFNLLSLYHRFIIVTSSTLVCRFNVFLHLFLDNHPERRLI